jgi:TatA/E family protein of Tat protein translocase
METVGPWELLVIVLVLTVVFGSGRLPGMARNLGQGLREFRAALREADSVPDGPAAFGDAGVRGTPPEGHSPAGPGS